jgi:hypothetical protein
MKSNADLAVQGQISVYLIHPLTIKGENWLEENVFAEQRFGGAVAVEHRFISDIVEAALAGGLLVEITP